VALDRRLVDAQPAARMIKRFDEVARDRVLNHPRYSVTAKHCNQHDYLDGKRAALGAGSWTGSDDTPIAAAPPHPERARSGAAAGGAVGACTRRSTTFGAGSALEMGPLAGSP
jgi:hypothetical protein